MGRKTCTAIRYAYRIASAKVKSDGKAVTIRTIANEIGIGFKTAQSFLYREHEFAREIGLELEYVTHDVAEYINAIRSIDSQVRPTCRHIAQILGLEHSSVARFLKKHPEVRLAHPHFGIEKRRKPAGAASAVKKPAHVKTPPIPKQPVVPEVQKPAVVEEVSEPVSRSVGPWRDLYVSVWDESICRYAGVLLNRSQYLDYWKRGLLEHQHAKGKTKPSHLPTPEEVAAMT